MPAKHIDIGVRPIKSEDLVEIVEIESDSQLLPWSRREFERCLKRRNAVGFVATADTHIIAYVVLEIFKEFFQLLTLAVHPAYRRHKVGTRLLGYVADQLIPTKRRRICIEVRERDLGAQLFLQECRYRATDIVRDYYDDTGEDCYKFEFRPQWPDKLVNHDTKGYYSKKKEDIS